jgi:hypothetical protein
VDYFDILKRAWQITWRYKALWVLGLFVGAGSGGGSGGGGNTGFGGGESEFLPAIESASAWAESNLLLIAIAVGVLVMIGLVWWLLSIAAQGALVHGANAAAEGREVRLGEAWGVGFRRWGRTFMTALVVYLPLLILIFVLVGLMVGGVVAAEAAGDAGAGFGFLGLCLGLPLFIVIAAVLAVVLSIVFELALRWGVLFDVTFGQAIQRGWSDLWGKRGAFVMWLVTLLPAFAFGIVTFILLLIGLVPAVFLFMAEQHAVAIGVALIVIVVMMLPSAVYGTFYSTTWTVFFRRMTGLEQAAPTPAPAPSGDWSDAGLPPAPPAAAPAPWAPPPPPAG